MRRYGDVAPLPAPPHAHVAQPPPHTVALLQPLLFFVVFNQATSLGSLPTYASAQGPPCPPTLVAARPPNKSGPALSSFCG